MTASTIAAIEKYVDFCAANVVTDTSVTIEKHHVITRKLMPRLIKDENNLVRLTPAAHLKAHYLLALAMPNDKRVVLAFHFMCNIKGKERWQNLKADGYSDAEIEEFARAYGAAKIALKSARPKASPKGRRRRRLGEYSTPHAAALISRVLASSKPFTPTPPRKPRAQRKPKPPCKPKPPRRWHYAVLDRERTRTQSPAERLIAAALLKPMTPTLRKQLTRALARLRKPRLYAPKPTRLDYC